MCLFNVYFKLPVEQKFWRCPVKECEVNTYMYYCFFCKSHGKEGEVLKYMKT